MFLIHTVLVMNKLVTEFFLIYSIFVKVLQLCQDPHLKIGNNCIFLYEVLELQLEILIMESAL